MAGLTKRVRRAFDATVLKKICELPEGDFGEYADKHMLAPSGLHPNDERFFYFKNHGSNILAVAHLDNVWNDPTCHVVNTTGGLLALSGALDDRLGAYIILELLPKLGLQFDILLTTDEESCGSTADEFDIEKEYNWIIEFDRGGTDVVMYEYQTWDLKDKLKEVNADVGIGSFSDICVLEHLGCKAFNWGVGYREYHGPRSHAWLVDTFSMVAKFLRFYAANKDTHFPHVEIPWAATTYGAGYGYASFKDQDDQSHSYRKDPKTGEWVETEDDRAALAKWLRERAGEEEPPDDDPISVAFHDLPDFCPICPDGEVLIEGFCPICGFDVESVPLADASDNEELLLRDVDEGTREAVRQAMATVGVRTYRDGD